MDTGYDYFDKLRRIPKILIFCTFVFLLLGVSAVGTVYAQPDCEEVNYVENPSGELLVGNVDELQCITDGVTGDYKLVANIDASETEDWNNGTGFEPIGPTFRGTFDGDGYTVSGLTIDRENQSGVGLFSSASLTTSIENVDLEDVNITGDGNVGGLVGENIGEITDVSVTGTVTGEGDVVGGVAGRNVDATVTLSHTDARVGGQVNVGGIVGRNTGEVSQSYSTSDINGDTNVGGVVGYNLIDVHNTYATGTVEGRVTIGGLVGQNRGKGEIRDSYAAGLVDGAEAGGLVGLNDNADIKDSYFDAITTGERDRARRDTSGIGLTTEEMTGENAPGNMTGLDFDENWEVESDDYPVLAWETGEGFVEETDEDDDGTSVEDGLEDNEVGDEDTEENGNQDDDMLTTEETQEDDLQTDDEDADNRNGTTDEPDENGEGLPGFGLVVGILGALGAAGLSKRKHE